MRADALLKTTEAFLLLLRSGEFSLMTTSALSSPLALSDQRDQSFFNGALLCVLLLAAFQVQIGGQVLLCDFLILPLTITAVITRGLPRTAWTKICLLAVFAWLFALMLADIVNGSSIDNIARGWLRNGLACSYLVFFVTVLRPQKKSLIMAALGMGICMVGIAFSEQTALVDIVKFGLGPGLLWLVCGASMYSWARGRCLWSVVGIASLMLLALFVAARSFLSYTVIVLCLMLMAYYAHRFLRLLNPFAFIAVLVVGAAGVAGGIAAGYGSVVSTGMLGEAAKHKYEVQSKGGLIGTIWNARPEMRIATRVVADNPILGHGSWYRNEQIAALELLFSNYVSSTSSQQEAKAIIESGGVQAMGHSAILQSWVEAGIVGAFFWLLVFVTCLVGITRQLQHPTVLSPLVFVAATELMFDSLFSPFVAAQRVSNMLELAVVLTALGVKVVRLKSVH